MNFEKFWSRFAENISKIYKKQQELQSAQGCWLNRTISAGTNLTKG